ncbi:MAG: transcriptional regulator [Spirochaetales bacterium]|nr:MAG: transcriptional regulator [Spirochaetales bacterium]
MVKREDSYESALKIAQMYYHHQMNTDEIAKTLGFSRAKVSRLLNHARKIGIVEVRIIDHRHDNDPLSMQLKRRYRGLHEITIVPVEPDSSTPEQLTRVAQTAAVHLSNDIICDNHIVAVSAGEILSLVARNLPKRPMKGVQIVQLQGNTAGGSCGIGYIGGILQKFASAFEGELVLYPVPMMFATEEARKLMWNEPSIRIAREYQQRADTIIFTVGVAHLTWERMLLSARLNENREHRVLLDRDVVGDLATVFYRIDGTFKDLAINQQSSGPALETYRQVGRSVCIVAGQEKILAVHAALNAGYISDLIIDSATALALREMDFSKYKLTSK